MGGVKETRSAVVSQSGAARIRPNDSEGLVLSVQVVFHRIPETLQRNAFVDRGNAHNLLKMAQKASRAPTPKSLALAKAPNLKLTGTIDRSHRPVMHAAEMESMNFLRPFKFQMVSLHNTPLFREHTFDAYSLGSEEVHSINHILNPRIQVTSSLRISQGHCGSKVCEVTD